MYLVAIVAVVAIVGMVVLYMYTAQFQGVYLDDGSSPTGQAFGRNILARGGPEYIVGPEERKIVGPDERRGIVGPDVKNIVSDDDPDHIVGPDSIVGSDSRQGGPEYQAGVDGPGWTQDQAR